MMINRQRLMKKIQRKFQKISLWTLLRSCQSHLLAVIVCITTLTSNNQLHKHLPKSCKGDTDVQANHTFPLVSNIIDSDSSSNFQFGLGFRVWYYLTVKAKIGSQSPFENFCLDTGCAMSMIERNYLGKALPNYKNLGQNVRFGQSEGNRILNFE